MPVYRRVGAFAPEALTEFAASVADLPPDERQKAKLLYIRNGIAEFRNFEKMAGAFPRPAGCLSILPFVGRIAQLQQTMLGGALDMQRQQIVNAIDLWRDDLKAAGFDVDRFDVRSEMEP
jgi:hypothetical protein